MQDNVKGNSEESLRRALAEWADETALGQASDRVRLRLRREVRRRARRRWALVTLAAAAALAAVLFGITLRMTTAVRPGPSHAARGIQAPGASTTPSPAAREDAATPELKAESGEAGSFQRSSAAVKLAPAARSRKARNVKPEAPGDWRKGEVVLSPWYYNTALPPSARSVLVRSEVDARTALRFGVAPAGDTAPVEILFGEDGLPRAMRFVRHLATQQN